MQFSNTQLQSYNTLDLPAFANFAVLSSKEQISALLEAPKPLFFLGQGSNVLMQENISHNVVQIGLKGINLIKETSDYYFVQAAAGESWHEFIRYCLSQGWYGLENLALIPGTVGAAPVQNIGAYGAELKDYIDSVATLNLTTQEYVVLKRHECGFAYRDSIFKQSPPGNWLILNVNFALPKKWVANLKYHDLQREELLKNPNPLDIFNVVCAIRQAKLPDPAFLPNAGSFFKNPVVELAVAEKLQQTYTNLRYFPAGRNQAKLAAAWLIEQAGWRGKRLGPVGMHKQQALVLVNYDGAIAQDVIKLATVIRADVKSKFGVTLEQEPVLLS